MKKTGSLSAEQLEDLHRRAEETRKKVAHKPGIKELLTPEELDAGAPFYFVLRDFIAQVKQARQKAGLSLADVSQRCGIAVESLSKLETGAFTNPTWKTLGTYAKAVGCRPELTARID